MMDTKIEKKQLIIFIIIAYGVTFLMGIPLWYGYTRQLPTAAFPNAQMLYPAAGVMLAYLLTRKKDPQMPRAFFVSYLLVTAILIACSIFSVVLPDMYIGSGDLAVNIWLMILQYAMIGGSILCFICTLIAGKNKREAYGLRWKNWGASLFCILLFFLLHLARFLLAYGLDGQLQLFLDLLKSPGTWIMLLFLPVNLVLSYIAFFGEEYGWRYYLQPLLQKKFGLRGGVLLLGVVWGLWHLPLDFFFYVRPENGLIQLTNQIITCVTLGIFFAYAYQKTQNIWVPVILHFLNNNLAVVFSPIQTADVLQYQEVTWSMVPLALVINMLFFGSFLLSKQFRKGKEAASPLETNDFSSAE
ncbi:MAG: CPBP family intramembrane metalloprotease [Lachnospiraceae bacterium]|jgi:membrane protease YdiL (CAAX protease family)|nr:CPBP family intramembrane metalloprotease [Lachnospiraceae bacterium]MCI8996204.1 CPBP family intramembrane metalloprotease [Lachnospiraceae bacterium]